DREMLLLAAATEAHPESPILLNNLSAAHLRRHEYEKAKDAAEKGIAIAPELPQLRRNLAAALEAISHADRTTAQTSGS
ncbi:MAG TPA: hypothetical protein VM166_00150, partial [Gemmatimonadaceae bacterium]|nr:hypothetical protein [Gemmatimonadaceae bacterium]